MSIRKFVVSDFNLKTDGLPAEQKVFMENIAGMMCEVVNKSLEGVATPEDVTKQFGDINNLLKAYDGEKFVQLVKDNEALVDQVKKLGESIEKMKQKGLSMSTINKFNCLVIFFYASIHIKKTSINRTKRHLCIDHII